MSAPIPIKGYVANVYNWLLLECLDIGFGSLNETIPDQANTPIPSFHGLHFAWGINGMRITSFEMHMNLMRNI